VAQKQRKKHGWFAVGKKCQQIAPVDPKNHITFRRPQITLPVLMSQAVEQASGAAGGQ